MTGYLHISDDAKLAAAVQDAIRDYPCTQGHEGDECPTAIVILSVLRGLSVEPTEAVWDGVGIREAADILGVSKQRINQLSTRPEFPATALRLKAGPIWRRCDVVRYAATRRRTSGRPVAAPVPVQEDRP